MVYYQDAKSGFEMTEARIEYLSGCARSVVTLAHERCLFSQLIQHTSFEEISGLCMELSLQSDESLMISASRDLLTYITGVSLHILFFDYLKGQAEMIVFEDLCEKMCDFVNDILSPDSVVFEALRSTIVQYFNIDAGDDARDALCDNDLLHWFLESFNMKVDRKLINKINPTDLTFVNCCSHCRYCLLPDSLITSQGCIRKFSSESDTYQQHRSCSTCTPSRKRIQFGSCITRTIPSYTSKQKRRLFYSKDDIHGFIAQAAWEKSFDQSSGSESDFKLV